MSQGTWRTVMTDPTLMQIVPTRPYEPSLKPAARLVGHAFRRFKEMESLIAGFRWDTVPSFTMPAADEARPEISLRGETDPVFNQWDQAHEVSLSFGEMVNSLRGALDHVVYALAWRDSGAEQRNTQFPIVDSNAKFRERRTRDRMKGLSPVHVSAIEAVQPYTGVKWIRDLRDLNNQHKHRRPVEARPCLWLEIGPDAAESPDDPSRMVIRVTQQKITCRIVDPTKKTQLNPYPDVIVLSNAMFKGIAEFLNPLFAEEDRNLQINLAVH